LSRAAFPNSVVFDYDALPLLFPTVFIFSNHGTVTSQKRSLSRAHRHTSIYYYPGNFDAKLVVNREVKKEHSLLITTDGWLPLAKQTRACLF
jgi:hypothetical protein